VGGGVSAASSLLGAALCGAAQQVRVRVCALVCVCVCVWPPLRWVRLCVARRSRCVGLLVCVCVCDGVFVMVCLCMNVNVGVGVLGRTRICELLLGQRLPINEKNYNINISLLCRAMRASVTCCFGKDYQSMGIITTLTSQWE